jgi:lysophospholipase L1-like esterase
MSRELEIKNIVCLGDSITAGKSVPENRRWTSLVQAGLDGAESGRWSVYGRGMPGETIAEGLERFEGDVAGLMPAVVLIEFGLNDCSHRANRKVPRTGLNEFVVLLGEVIRLVRGGGGHPVLLTNHRINPERIEETSGARCAENLAPYQSAIRRAAGLEQTSLIDVEAGFDRVSDLGPLLSPDGIHLTCAGHRHYAGIVTEDLQPILEALT